MAEDKYAVKWIEAIKKCVNDEQLALVINKIYDDGFTDGQDENNADSVRESMAGEAEFIRDSRD